ncbi:tetratricopeptide repeat protein [Hyphobacterium sp. SN044]|uniref:tetratricopeptide repeat protein n=1 Tax=Hyphobacterium sp. SN044 TaxID=2912575 RepID=UPI001F1F8298|nr:tetratricopeptide repeat protein [Hyphobacterium sp. SN044]MCF8880555.1 tetratricopeptide repeat protein [Hyphobacterium sp. SN044]
MRCVFALALVFALSAPVSADLRDVVLSRDGDTAWIQLVFDEAPSHGELLAEQGGLAVAFTAPGIVPPAIEAAEGDVLRAIQFSDFDGQTRADFDLAVAWTEARVRVEGDRVIVRLSGVSASGDGLPASHLTTPAAAGEPAAADEPSTGAPHGGAGLDGDAVTPDTDHEAEAAVAADIPAGPAELTPEDANGTTPPAAVAGDACAEADARIVDDPWDLDAMIVQAECARSNGNADEAAALLERVTAMDPERFSALLMLAEIQSERGDRDAARALYEMAAQAARTDGEAAAAMARMRALAD